MYLGCVPAAGVVRFGSCTFAVDKVLQSTCMFAETTETRLAPTMSGEHTTIVVKNQLNGVRHRPHVHLANATPFDLGPFASLVDLMDGLLDNVRQHIFPLFNQRTSSFQLWPGDFWETASNDNWSGRITL